MISLTLEPLAKVAHGFSIQICSVRRKDMKAIWFAPTPCKRTKYSTDEKSSSTED